MTQDMGASVPDQALVSDQAATRLDPTGFDPSRGPAWHIGVSDESYGARVWFSRVENLRCHLKIIQNYVPEEKSWLHRQIAAAIDEADRYLADWSPLYDSDGSAEGGETRSGSTEGNSADPKGIAHTPPLPSAPAGDQS